MSYYKRHNKSVALWLTAIGLLGLMVFGLLASVAQADATHDVRYTRNSVVSQPFSTPTSTYDPLLMISGKVVDEHGNPLEGVAVRVYGGGSGFELLTNAQGVYSAQGFHGGKFTFSISAQFIPFEQTVSIPPETGVNFQRVAPTPTYTPTPQSPTPTYTPTPTQTPLPTPSSVAVFIPGVTGSTQLAADKTDLWPGLSTIAGLLFGDTYKRLSLESGAVEPNIISGDAIRVAGLPFGFESNPAVKNLVDSTIVYKPFLDYMVNDLGYREYLVENDPKRRKASEGCQDKEQASRQPTLFVFAYDWRQSITDNATLLDDYIDCIHKFYPGIKVTLIGHSMGGLLARKYIVMGGAPNVSTLITINTPWFGAPKVLQTMLDGTWQAPYSRPVLKKLVQHFPGAYQLIPSARYFSTVGLAPFREGGIDLDKDGQLDEPYVGENDFDAFFGALGYTTSPYGVNSTFFDNAFLNPQAGSFVRSYSLITQQEGNTTPGQIYNLSTTVCNTGESGEYVCQDISFYTDVLVTGDGTVPLESLEGMLKSNIGTTSLFVSYSHASDHLYSHKSATSNPRVLVAIASILNGATMVSAATVEAESDHLSRYVRLHGAEAVTITHPISGSISSTDHTLSIFSFPDVVVNEEDTNGYLITMPSDATYTITYKSSKPVFLATNISDGANNIKVSQSFNNQPRTQNGELTLHVSSSPLVSLTYQTESGISEVLSTGTYTGSTPVDQLPPVVSITQTTVGLVQVSAVDASAVSQVYVSTNSSEYTPYTQPFPALAGTVVTAFADDSVGNRSDVVRYPVTGGTIRHIYLPLVKR